eukprot:gene5983-7454_t
MAAATQMQQLQDQFVKARETFQDFETELQKLSGTRAKLLTQLNENEMVKKEFDLLEEDANIYKLVGPVLFKHSKSDAESNIKARLDMIDKHLKKTEADFKETEKKAIDQRNKVMELQNKIRLQMQQQQQQQQQQPQ